MEPIATFVSDLLCLCPRFEAKFDAQSLLTIIEALPTDWTPSPRVELALDMVADACLRKVEGFPQPTRIRLVSIAKQLPGERWSLMVEQMEKPIPSAPEEQSEYVEDSQRISSETLQLSSHALHTGQHDIQEHIKAHKQSDDRVTSDRSHELFCPAYVSVQPRPWRIPDVPDSKCSFRCEEPAYVNLEGEELAYVKTLQSEWMAPEDQDTTLVVLNKIKPSGEAYGRTSIITFEVNSKAGFETCKVKVDCHYDSRKYHSRSYCLEVGNNAPNTQTLCLTSLPLGMHEMRFSWQGKSGRPKFESFSFCVEAQPKDREPCIIRMKRGTKGSSASCSTGIGSNSIGTADSDEGEAA